MLERRFALTARGTYVRTEALGGLTTFLSMSYIILGHKLGWQTGMAAVVSRCGC